MSWVLILIVLLTSVWWREVWSETPAVALVLLVSALALSGKRLGWWIGVPLLLLVFLWQVQNPSWNGERKPREVVEMYWQRYAEVLPRDSGLLWKIPAWFEVNKMSIRIEGYQERLSVVTNIGYYFFANHPMERPGVSEQEKLSFWWMIFWMIGFFEWVSRFDRAVVFFACVLLSALALPAIGPVVLLPFMVVQIAWGLLVVRRKIYER